MKKILSRTFVIVMIGFCSGCTPNQIAREYGGTVKVKVDPGYKVTSATWKGEDLFYFIEPMEDGYVPKEKKFVESSSYGILESTVIFKESRN